MVRAFLSLSPARPPLGPNHKADYPPLLHRRHPIIMARALLFLFPARPPLGPDHKALTTHRSSRASLSLQAQAKGGPAFSLGDLQAGAKGLQQVDDVPKKAEGKGDDVGDAALGGLIGALLRAAAAAQPKPEDPVLVACSPLVPEQFPRQNPFKITKLPSSLTHNRRRPPANPPRRTMEHSRRRHRGHLR